MTRQPTKLAKSTRPVKSLEPIEPMKPMKRTAHDLFAAVRKVGLSLPDVEVVTKYDGSPVLKVRGCFMAGLAMHPSAEPDTLVVRADIEERAWLLTDAPGTYYTTEYYERHPVVLVRLSRLDRNALHDLLAVSRRLTLAKTPVRSRSRSSNRNQATAEE